MSPPLPTWAGHASSACRSQRRQERGASLPLAWPLAIIPSHRPTHPPTRPPAEDRRQRRHLGQRERHRWHRPGGWRLLRPGRPQHPAVERGGAHRHRRPGLRRDGPVERHCGDEHVHPAHHGCGCAVDDWPEGGGTGHGFKKGGAPQAAGWPAPAQLGPLAATVQCLNGPRRHAVRGCARRAASHARASRHVHRCLRRRHLDARQHADTHPTRETLLCAAGRQQHHRLGRPRQWLVSGRGGGA